MLFRLYKPSLYLGSFLGGMGLTLAFSPFNQRYWMFLGPALLFLCLSHPHRQEAYGLAYAFCLGFFSLGASWVFVSIHTYGNTPLWLALCLTLAFIAFIALLQFLPFLLYRWLYPQTKPQFMQAPVFGLIWLVSELFRSNFATGFPWLLLGYSSIGSLFESYLPLVGSLGLGALLATLGAILVLFTRLNRFQTGLCLTWILLFFGGALYLFNKTWTTPLAQTLSVALVQANIEQSLKWDPDYFDHILRKYRRLSEEAPKANLVIWPEGAIPAPYPYVLDYFNQLADQATARHQTFFIGTFLPVDSGLANGLLSLGTYSGSYLKHHLVPFGEYLPFQPLLKGLIPFFNLPMSNLIPGVAHPPPLQLGNFKLSLSICYEIAYSSLILPNAAGANLLINISDDSWFGQSIATAQQVEIAQVRAKETGLPFLLTNNNGLSSIISSEGKIRAQLPMNQAGILTAELHPYSGQTPIVKFFAWLSRRK